jgi:hypothetical protein
MLLLVLLFQSVRPGSSQCPKIIPNIINLPQFLNQRNASHYKIIEVRPATRADNSDTEAGSARVATPYPPSSRVTAQMVPRVVRVVILQTRFTFDYSFRDA